jgi:hypothetical protein
MGDGGQYVMIYLAMMMHVSFVGNLGLQQEDMARFGLHLEQAVVPYSWTT